MPRLKRPLCLLALTLMGSMAAHAVPTVFNFEGVVPVGTPTGTPAIGTYYTGTVFDNAFAARSVKATPAGAGNFGLVALLQGSGTPGTSIDVGVNAMFLGDNALGGGDIAWLDVAAGFNESFKFHYAFKPTGLTVTLYEALTADVTGTTGSVSLSLAPTTQCGPGDPGSEFCRWSLADFGALLATYRSVKFTGPDNGGFIDNITFSSTSSTTPGLPEPGSLALVAVALAGVGAASRRRKS